MSPTKTADVVMSRSGLERPEGRRLSRSKS